VGDRRARRATRRCHSKWCLDACCEIRDPRRLGIGGTLFRQPGASTKDNRGSLLIRLDDAKRIKELERENTRLKKVVADQALDIDMLRD